MLSGVNAPKFTQLVFTNGALGRRLICLVSMLSSVFIWIQVFSTSSFSIKIFLFYLLFCILLFVFCIEILYFVFNDRLIYINNYMRNDQKLW